ncbi:MAG: hypothetical protein H7Y31_18315 [Chitinophagaceae bacterium]|nr:hypothetical protein [Chitinophagaceae bacterium]
MKALLVCLTFCSFILSCNKDRGGDNVHVTVLQDSNHSPGAVLVEVENAVSGAYSFLCINPPQPGAPGHSCGNSVYILNLPASLKAPGTQLVFTKWADLGRNMIWSSTYASNDIKVFDPRKRN